MPSRKYSDVPSVPALKKSFGGSTKLYRAADPYRHCSPFEKSEEINRRFSPFPAGTLLVLWDVISMYPNIDIKVGLDACKTPLNHREKLSPSTDLLLEAIKITLKCNNSIFNNKHYRQNRGMAMGPHNACSYADLAMTTFDNKILDTNTRPNNITFHQIGQDFETTV